MKKIEIYEFQAKHIENTFRIVANILESHSKEACIDRDVMKSWEYIKNVLKEQPEIIVK